MIAFLADENLKRKIIAFCLQWAARHKRVLLTHDVQTLIGFAWESVRAGKPMAGVIVLGRNLRVSEAIEELLLIAECSEPEEWTGVVAYLPL